MIPFYIGGYWTIPILPIAKSEYSKKWNKPLAMIQSFLIPIVVSSISIFRLNVVKTNFLILPPSLGESALFYTLVCAADKVQYCLVKFQLSGRHFDNRSVHLSDPFRSHLNRRKTISKVNSSHWLLSRNIKFSLVLKVSPFKLNGNPI